MDQVWRFNVNYTKVSDSNYFNDFSSKYGSSTDGYATQIFSVGYAVENFNATVSTKQFQVFDSENSNSYGAEPQLDVNWYQNDLGPFDTRIYGQAVHFVNTNTNANYAGSHPCSSGADVKSARRQRLEQA